MLFKRKRIPFPVPGDARKLTEEEMILVNGGSERRENSNEGVAGADVGDTIQRNDGTVVTLSQGDIDYAKAQLEKECTSPTPSATPTNSPTPSNNTPPSPTSTNKTNDATANTVKGPNHHSAYDQQFINEMMEKEQKSAVGGNGIQGTAVSGKAVKGNQTTANQGAGTMNVTDYIAQQRKMGVGATVPGQAVGGEKVEGQTAGERSVVGGNLMGQGYPSSTEGYPDAYKTSEKNGIERIVAIEHPKNPVSPDNIVTTNPNKAGKNSRKSITDLVADYNKKNNANLPLCVESYNYLRTKGENFGYADNGGWARLQDMDNANRTMQEGLGKKMGDGTDLGLQGCKVMAYTKIESEIIGERIEMDNLNGKATSGKLGVQTVIDDLNERLEQNGDPRRAVGKVYKGEEVNRALLDTISSSEDTIYVVGKALGVAGGPHWFELDGYSINEYIETQFQYYPSSDYDVSNNRIYLLGSKSMDRDKDKKIVNENIFSVSVIETISLGTQF